jgi:3-dehydroquinate dehydratase/shikimate dehydrogenase
VEKSLGAHFHNAQFASTARNAVYVKIPLTIEEIPAFVSWSKSFAVRGLSVTMPYKESIVSYLQQLDSIVHEIQACNTIHSTSSGWSGYNTDGIGALNAIEAKLPVRGKRIVILGAGGSGKAIAYEAIRRGAHITVFNRSSKTLFPGCRTLPFDSLPQTDYDILISCLPDLNRCVQEHWILPRTLLMDITYTSENPLLKRWAEEKECTLVPGDAMFYQQALEQQRLWQSS